MRSPILCRGGRREHDDAAINDQRSCQLLVTHSCLSHHMGTAMSAALALVMSAHHTQVLSQTTCQGSLPASSVASAAAGGTAAAAEGDSPLGTQQVAHQLLGGSPLHHTAGEGGNPQAAAAADIGVDTGAVSSLPGPVDHTRQVLVQGGSH